jgi:hypothetical protein
VGVGRLLIVLEITNLSGELSLVRCVGEEKVCCL